MKRLKKKGTHLDYVTIEELFDTIHYGHLSVGHGARDISYPKIGESMLILRRK